MIAILPAAEETSWGKELKERWTAETQRELQQYRADLETLEPRSG